MQAHHPYRTKLRSAHLSPCIVSSPTGEDSRAVGATCSFASNKKRLQCSCRLIFLRVLTFGVAVAQPTTPFCPTPHGDPTATQVPVTSHQLPDSRLVRPQTVHLVFDPRAGLIYGTLHQSSCRFSCFGLTHAGGVARVSSPSSHNFLS